MRLNLSVQPRALRPFNDAVLNSFAENDVALLNLLVQRCSGRNCLSDVFDLLRPLCHDVVEYMAMLRIKEHSLTLRPNGFPMSRRLSDHKQAPRCSLDLAG